MILPPALVRPLPPTRAATPTPPECFPIERLPARLRKRAEEAVWKILDGEGLYTVVGGIKPMSSGWASLRVDVASPNPSEIADLERIVSVMRCGTVRAHVQRFSRVYEGKRYVEAVIVDEPHFARTVAANPGLFGYYGVSPESGPAATLAAFDGDDRSERNRCYGVLYGYPARAVDFFCAATDQQKIDGKLVPRDFVSIDTFLGSNHFVYAIPKGSPEEESDADLRRRTAPILRTYRAMRPRFFGPGRRGPAALLREWFAVSGGFPGHTKTGRAEKGNQRNDIPRKGIL